MEEPPGPEEGLAHVPTGAETYVDETFAGVQEKAGWHLEGSDWLSCEGTARPCLRLGVQANQVILQGRNSVQRPL